MTNKELIRKSILDKWWPILKRGAVDKGREDCPLCGHYEGYDCDVTDIDGQENKCPLRGNICCEEYIVWDVHMNDDHTCDTYDPSQIYCDECYDYAGEMLLRLFREYHKELRKER